MKTHFFLCVVWGVINRLYPSEQQYLRRKLFQRFVCLSLKTHCVFFKWRSRHVARLHVGVNNFRSQTAVAWDGGKCHLGSFSAPQLIGGLRWVNGTWKQWKTQHNKGGGYNCNCNHDDYKSREKEKQFGVELPPTLILIVI